MGTYLSVNLDNCMCFTRSFPPELFHCHSRFVHLRYGLWCAIVSLLLLMLMQIFQQWTQCDCDVEQGQFAPVKGNYSEEFKSLIMDMLQQHPEDRPSASDLCNVRLPQVREILLIGTLRISQLASVRWQNVCLSPVDLSHGVPTYCCCHNQKYQQ